MVSLPDDEKISKISLLVLAKLRNVTDRQTDGRTPGDSIYRAYAYASRGKKRLHFLAYLWSESEFRTQRISDRLTLRLMHKVK